MILPTSARFKARNGLIALPRRNVASARTLSLCGGSTNWYKHYLGDYGRATGDLSLAEHGAYRLLLDHYYAAEGRIPAALAALQRLCRASDDLERAAVEVVVRRFFPENGDGVRHNKRADEEIVKWHAQLDHNREVGKLGGRPTKTRRVSSGFPPDNPEITRVGTRKEPNPEARSQKPDIQNPVPEASFQNPETSNQAKSKPSLGVQKRTPQREESGATIETWNAYSEAYKRRYQEFPVRNATVNGQLAQVVKRLGSSEAPAVAAFYVGHNGNAYVREKHPVGLLLRGCEGLRTEWATNRMVTETDARQVDRTQSNFNSFAPLIEAARQREKNRGTK